MKRPYCRATKSPFVPLTVQCTFESASPCGAPQESGQLRRPSTTLFILSNTIICQACEHTIEIGTTLADAAEEHAWVEKRRDSHGVQAFLDSIGAPSDTTVTMTQTMKLRLLNWP